MPGTRRWISRRDFFYAAGCDQGNWASTLAGRLEHASQQLDGAKNDFDRFVALGSAAKESFASGHIDDANRFANELLQQAPHYRANWNYGNAIQDGNLVLGRIAVHEHRITDAKEFLKLAGDSAGSPQLDSFGPNMSLAKDLLEAGEKDAVLAYFEACSKFWKDDFGKLAEWTDAVQAGREPRFGANLIY